MLTKKQRDDMREALHQVDGGNFHEGADMPPKGMAKFISDFRLCLDDLAEKDEAIIDLQTTAEGEIQHTDVMDCTVERLKKELAAKDKELAGCHVVLENSANEIAVKDERIEKLEAEVAELNRRGDDAYRGLL